MLFRQVFSLSLLFFFTLSFMSFYPSGPHHEIVAAVVLLCSTPSLHPPLKKKSAFSSTRSSHNHHFRCSASVTCYCVLPCHLQLGLPSSKREHGVFNVRNDHSACCAHESETDTEESAQVLTKKSWKMVLHAVESRNRTFGPLTYSPARCSLKFPIPVLDKRSPHCQWPQTCTKDFTRNVSVSFIFLGRSAFVIDFSSQGLN